VDALNPTLQVATTVPQGRVVAGVGWYDTDRLGIDQGPILAMIENYRSGLVWRTLRRNPHVVRGLRAAGFRGGWLDRLIMALVEVVLTFPSIVLSIAIVAVIGAGTGSVIIAIAVTTAPAIAVIARATTLSGPLQDYVQAARALGAADGRIMLRHVLRNIFPPVLTETTLRISQAILVAAALGFLGLGVQPPLPEWGTMLSQGRNYLAVAPHMTYFSGLFIALLVLGFNLAGDTLRDMYDPRLKDV
jgi:ABC-type dipeptide/oligopeptide/nickel transport system permease subunit